MLEPVKHLQSSPVTPSPSLEEEESSSSNSSLWPLPSSLARPEEEDVTKSPPFVEDQETEIDEEYWRHKYPHLKPGSMARELTQSEVDNLQSQLAEAVATFKDFLPTWSNLNIHDPCGHQQS